MIITKEYQELLVKKYAKNHTFDECVAFVDGLNTAFKLIGNKPVKCIDKDALIEDLNDKRIVGKTINSDMYNFSLKETAEYLLSKYEIRLKY